MAIPRRVRTCRVRPAPRLGCESSQDCDRKGSVLRLALKNRRDSIVERHPADGNAHARVARLLEREGLVPEADLAWQRAIAVEPTDPTWLVGRAQNRLASGDRDTARALALQVTAGKWQDRFWQPVQEAAALKEQLTATTL